jgi:hypothetical protein
MNTDELIHAGFMIASTHKRDLRAIGEYLQARAIADVSNPTRENDVSLSAVLRFLIDDYAYKMKRDSDS